MNPELFKGGVHAVTGGLAAAMTLYSGLRLTEEKQARGHLWLNVGVYALLWGWEGYQTWRHWSR